MPEAISLSSLQWQLRQAEAEQWIPASVPGSVFTDLMEAGILPDVYFGANEQEVQWVGEKSWEYKTQFNLSSEQLKFPIIELEFEGLDTYAKVYLNGTLLLEADNMFRSWKADIKPLAREGINELSVVFEPVIPNAKQAAKAIPYTLPEGERVFVRKAAYHFGWDWGPKFLTSGIWKEGSIRFYEDLRIEDLHFQLKELNEKRANYNLEIRLHNPSGRPIYLEVDIGNGWFSEDIGEFIPIPDYQYILFQKPGLDLYNEEISIPSPKLWWTHDLGEQHMYDVKVRLRERKDGKILDQRELRLGIRQIELVQEPDSIGSSFYFKLNGVPIFAKGANYIPADFFNHRSVERIPGLIHEAKQAGMNMLRVWGGGVYEDKAFYDACDEAGILIWQDFMFANTMYHADEAFLNSVSEEVNHQVRRLRHHPSIALWCGNNEISEGWYNWGWQRQFGYTKEDSTHIYQDYQRLFEQLIPGILKAQDPSRPYHPSSPSTGWGRKESLLLGDVHYWGVWWGMEPFEKYGEKIGRFHSEHGFQSIPMIPSLRKFIPQDELLLGSASMRTHQKHPTGYETIQAYLERDFPVPASLEDYAYMSQLLQAYGLSIATRAHRMAQPYTMGSLFWQLNDVWPVTSWSSIDYYGKPKALQYKLPELFASLMLGIDTKGQWVVVSDERKELNLSLKVERYDFEGKLVQAWNDSLRIPGFGSVRAPLPASLVSKRREGGFLLLTLHDADTTLASYYHYFDKPKNLPLRKLDLSAKVIDEDHIEISIDGGLAKDLYVEWGDRIAEQNFFDALPGKRVVRFRPSAQADPKAEIKLKALNHFVYRD